MANWGVNCRMKVSSPTFLVGSGTFTFVSYKLTHSPQFYKLLWGVCSSGVMLAIFSLVYLFLYTSLKNP